tara:strand:+ start:2342 stop:2764 length:423 start_codon:yes stop_codon:yes gene_type:complete
MTDIIDPTTGEMLLPQDAAARINVLRIAEADMRQGRQKMEFDLLQYMVAQGATALDHPTLNVKLQKGRPTYDVIKAEKTLPELISPERWNEAYTPESTKVVPAKLNGTKMNKLKELGDEVAKAVESLTMRADPVLKIEEK